MSCQALDVLFGVLKAKKENGSGNAGTVQNVKAGTPYRVIFLPRAPL